MNLLSIALLCGTLATDTIVEENLDVVVINAPATTRQKRSVKGQAASIDEHLSELAHVSMVRRGSYAWEPVVNNMQTERLSTTIDGMKIFYACTDKMDPVTSYVESGNLQSISLSSGLDGNPQATGNIGGSLDLRLRRVGFDAIPCSINLSAGHEWNGHLQVYGADAAFSTHRFYTNFGAFYRHADDYKTGGGHTLPFSQFRKVNAFVNVGVRLTERDVAESAFIFDRATDVGYPALNMDVSKAQGIIGSVSYRHIFDHPLLRTLETKIYHNKITHEMDDTHRPNVLIHMDMPGRSRTSGLYSLLTAASRRHDAQLNYDLYYNRLFADMTMYPGGAAPMYMVTWPDVGSLCTGLALSDIYSFATGQQLRVSAKLAWQTQRLNDEEGRRALNVFFPGLEDIYYQTTGRLAASYRLSGKQCQFSVGAGWGSRAPTVTEAYGYYLNNTFDRYDYIGNPSLSNEAAVELNTAFSYAPSSALNLKIDANAFFFSNYIIGRFETRLSPMTVGAEGVKVYDNLSHATIANASFTADWKPLSWLGSQACLSYAIGRDDDHDPLPLISPFMWNVSADATFSSVHLQLVLKGNARQVSNGAKYGETETASWTICNLSASYPFAVRGSRLTVRAGVENLFDKRYASYSDWNGIPQKGRNIYANLMINL